MDKRIEDNKLFTHNGRFTIQNRKTGEHRTFSVRTQKPGSKFCPGKRVVGLLTGSNNEADYTGFGFVEPDGINVWSRLRGRDGKRSAYEAFADMLFTLVVDAGFSPYAADYSLMAETVCRICNRTLTEPESIRSGIGPKCASRMDVPEQEPSTPVDDERLADVFGLQPE